MATVAERARELGVKILTNCTLRYVNGPQDRIDNAIENAAQFVEQALLAERRLAMEEAAKIADEPGFCCSECVGGSVSSAIAKSLRTAAEKEVG